MSDSAAPKRDLPTAPLARYEGRKPDAPDWFARALALPFESGRAEAEGAGVSWKAWGKRGKPGLIAVLQDGRRFCNEGLGYHDYVTALLRAVPKGAVPQSWLICTRAFQRRYGLGISRPAPVPAGPWIRRGYIKTGDTPEALARDPMELDGRIDWDRERAPMKERLLEFLDAEGYPTDVVVEHMDTPADWAARGLAAGTPFALAHTFGQTGPFRPHNIDRRAPGLVFAGSATTPGVGVPMVLVSGRLAAERVEQHLRTGA